MSKSKSSTLDLNTFLRTVGLLFAGVGSLVLGSSIDGVDEAYIRNIGIPQVTIIGIALAIATLGSLMRGILGLFFFAAGNALIGTTLFMGLVPHWGQALGIAMFMIGGFLRIMIYD